MPPNAITPRSLQVQPPLIAATKIEISSLPKGKWNFDPNPLTIRFQFGSEATGAAAILSTAAQNGWGEGRRAGVASVAAADRKGRPEPWLPPLNADAAEDARG